MSAAGGGANQGSEDVARMQALLQEAGITDYEPRVISQLLDVAYATTAELLTSARSISAHCHKPSVDETDIQIAMEFSGSLADRTPDRMKLLQMATDKNNQALPNIRHNFGLKLPNDRFCLLQQNVEWKGTDPVPQHVQPIIPRQEPVNVQQQLRPEHVSNLLKRKHDDDFDS